MSLTAGQKHQDSEITGFGNGFISQMQSIAVTIAKPN